MKANVTRYIDAKLLAKPDSVVDCIDIRLNGFVCHISYGTGPGESLAVWSEAASAKRVLHWAVCRSGCQLEGLPVKNLEQFETTLTPLLERVLDGHALRWTGREHEGYLTEDAGAASSELSALLLGPATHWTARDEARKQPDLSCIIVDEDWRARLRREVPSTVTHIASPDPLISIIVGVHNKSAYVLECLRSVLTQDGLNMEIICIDDASTDNSAEIVAEFASRDSRIRMFRNKTNRGAGITRNEGMTKARGKYVMFVDADDLVAPAGLKRLVELIESQGADMARGGIAFYHAGKDIQLRAADLPPGRASYDLMAEPHLWIPWWFTTFLYSKSFLDHHDLRFPSLTDGEDPVFLASALGAATRISSMSDVVYYYRRHRGQKRNDGDYLAHLETVREIFEGHDERIWWDGYGRHVAIHDIPARLMRRPEMAADPRYLRLMASMAARRVTPDWQ